MWQSSIRHSGPSNTSVSGIRTQHYPEKIYRVEVQCAQKKKLPKRTKVQGTCAPTKKNKKMPDAVSKVKKDVVYLILYL